MRMGGCVLALWVAAALLAGCGDKGRAETANAPAKKLQPIAVSLDRPEGPENVGIVMAEQRGYFADAGLDVELTVGLTPAWPIRYVTDGAVDIALSPQPQVVMAKERGLPIVAVGTLIPQSTSALIWLEKSKIDGIADLEGKTIAVPGLPFQKELLKVILADAGLTAADVKVEKIGREMVKALISGEVDAIFGGTWSVEGAELEARGLKPVITRVQDLGVPSYNGHVVVVRTKWAAKDPRLIRDFMAAVARGTAAAIEDPEGAVKAVEESPESNPEATPEGTKAGVEATLPLLSRSGYMSPGKTRRLVDWMFEEGMIQSKPRVQTLQTNAYHER